MSLPWKESKSGRLSRFLSEFQQSPKRGGSLVVETGFPASLIDLFVKNRDRLKKSSSKRLQRQTKTASNASLPIDRDEIMEKPVSRKPVRSNIEKVNFVGGGLAAENKHAIGKNSCVCGGDGGGAFVLMAFKVFIVAVLALSTKKKLTMGITLSAFALLLTELVAARGFTLFKLCKTDTEKEKPIVSIHEKNAISGEKNETLYDSVEYCGDKIGVPHTKSISCPKETDKSNLKVLTIRDLLLKDDKSKSKSSRLKSKIVKNLRSYKKKKTIITKEESLTEVSSLVSEDKSERIESETERDEKELNLPLMGSKGDKTNGIVLIVIVLTGLLSGKLLAIVLTISCLVLRFGLDKKYGLCI